jgi:hypothetical protein
MMLGAKTVQQRINGRLKILTNSTDLLIIWLKVSLSPFDIRALILGSITLVKALNTLSIK